MPFKGAVSWSLAGLLISVPLFFSCSNSSSTPPANPSSSAAGTVVEVSATASDDDPGDQSNLHYRWAATAGSIQNNNSATTKWVIPPGSGLQFAYVVVSDGKGGYAEKRAAALTFSQQPAASAPTITPITPAPPACAPTCKSESVWGVVVYTKFGRNVYLPNVNVELNGTSYTTDMKGEFFISNLSSGSYTATVKIPGNPDQPFTVFTGSTSRSSINFLDVSLPNTINFAGSVRMADHSFCGFRNEFFTKKDGSDTNLFTEPVYGTAELLDTANQPLSPPSSSPINYYGDFLIIRSGSAPAQVNVRIACEKDGPTIDSAPPITPINSLSAGQVAKIPKITFPNSRPKIDGMSVLLNGADIARPDLPKPRTVFASKTDPAAPHFGGDPDLIAEIIGTPGDDTFFTYKGLDTRRSACAYYQAIGAVTKCDLNGYPDPKGDQLTLDRWRSQFNLSPFPTGNRDNLPAPDGQEIRIQYINRSDLNLTRDMQAVKLSNGAIAYNVCNYPGPQDVTDPLGSPAEIGPQTDPTKDPSSIQANIDLAIDNARRGIGLIACVAMDYSPDSRVTKFYTFGPSGNLLLSVSLDGRREKFMPGACTACHGGTAYGGQYPDDGSRGPDLQSRWQPFAIANLKVKFSSTDEQNAIKTAVKTLNQRMVGGGAIPPDLRYDPMTTPRTRELITNWYISGGLEQDTSFIPSVVNTSFGSIFPNNADLLDFYHKVIEPGCQTCHAAQGTATSDISESIDSTRICGGNSNLDLNHRMPNSLVPFERLWLDPTLPPLLKCGTKPDHDPAL